MKSLNILILILLTNSAFAQNAVKLKKGDLSPFSGILVTEEKIIELDKAKRSNIVLKDLRIAQDELVEYHKQDARVQRRKLSEAKFSGFLANLGYFMAGVLITNST